MKIAIIGSRSLIGINIENYISDRATTIISGGAKGVDASAKAYALAHGLSLIEYLPEYKIYGKSAPLKRNIQIIKQADFVLAFWDGTSRGTKFVIDQCKQRNIPIKIYKLHKDSFIELP